MPAANEAESAGVPMTGPYPFLDYVHADKQKKAYTVGGAAKALSLPIVEVKKLIDTGQLSTILLAKKRRILGNEIDDLLRVYAQVQNKKGLKK